MYIDPATVAAGIAWDRRREIYRLGKRLWHLITRGTIKIVVFGPGGVGKSTLGKILAGEDVPPDQLSKYTESIVHEDYKLNADFIGRMRVPPGQRRRRDRRWKELYQDVASGKTDSIINLVGFGYHSLGEVKISELPVYVDGMSDEKFLQAYLDERRKAEIEVIREIAPYISAAKKVKWMVTLVNKQDLWWDKRDLVQKHYVDGLYNQEIEKISASLGKNNFAHEYVSASLISCNFMAGNRTLADTVAGYDEIAKDLNFRNFLRTVESLALR